jgi:hypothetical protein
MTNRTQEKPGPKVLQHLPQKSFLWNQRLICKLLKSSGYICGGMNKMLRQPRAECLAIASGSFIGAFLGRNHLQGPHEFPEARIRSCIAFSYRGRKSKWFNQMRPGVWPQVFDFACAKKILSPEFAVLNKA